jgi:hypothetical protein
MNQGTNDPSEIHADLPPKLVTGFTADPPAPAIRSRRVRWVLLTLISLAIAAAVGLVVAAATGHLQHLVVGFPTTPMTVEQADRMASAGPPPGSTLAEVEAWLASQGITSNPASSPGPSYDIWPYRNHRHGLSRSSMDNVGNQTVAECAGLRTDDVYTYVRVWYPDADRYFLGKDRIIIYFFFDADDRLLKHWVDVDHIMP